MHLVVLVFKGVNQRQVLVSDVVEVGTLSPDDDIDFAILIDLAINIYFQSVCKKIRSIDENV